MLSTSRWLLLAGLFVLLTSCAGERQIFKSPLAPRGLAVLEGGLEPSTPLALERAVAWVMIRDGVEATIHVAHVDSAQASLPGFVPTAELFTAFELDPVGEPDALGRRRYEQELPPRPSGRILYYWFEARDADGGRELLPASAPEGAIPVGSTRFEISFDWPGWSEPFDGLDCWADVSLFDFEYAGAGPNFDEIVAPIWVEKENATIFASTVGLDEGVGVVLNGQAYFYPLNMMVWNEVANDEQQGVRTVLSYCPLTDTSLFFSHDNPTKFRNWETAGLFNSNLVVGDPREPRSLIPQMLAFGVTGTREAVCVDILPSFLCRRGFWEALHPETLVMDGDRELAGDWNWLGMNNPYTSYWRSDNDIRATISNPDTEHPLGLQNKDLVIGVIGNGDPTVYPVHRSAPGGVIILNDDGGARPMLLIWLAGPHYGAVFDRRHPETGELLSFRRAATSYNGVGLLEDLSVEPSLWTPGGLAIAGPHAGTQLAWLPSMRAFWFAWHTTYPHSRMVELPTAEQG